MSTAGEAPPRLPTRGRVHLVGIGGAGMSALATVLLERGRAVSGSDVRHGRALEALTALGAQVHIGHDAAHVEGAAVVVASTAVPEHNPELVAAHEQGLPVLRRAELLAALLEGHRGVLVSGSHGKTTTTAMLTVVLQAAGADPSFAIGGTLHDAGTSAHHGSGTHFVAEADESDASFLVYRPDVALVTNVELDHHDRWGSLQELVEAFAAFLEQRTDGGLAVINIDDRRARDLVARARPPVRTVGEAADADVRITDVEAAPEGSTFRVHADGEDLGELFVRLPGRHNVANAAMAVAAARAVGADPEAIRTGLAAYRGTQRRFQRVGRAREITVVDDYAHHPTEVAAALDAAHQTRPAGRVIAVFQPHLYSRTAALAPELGAALAAADVTVVTDVYGAREQPVPGVTGQLVVDAARTAGAEVHFVPAISALPAQVADLARPGDLVLTIGAGDISESGPQILAELERGG